MIQRILPGVLLPLYEFTVTEQLQTEGAQWKLFTHSRLPELRPLRLLSRAKEK